MWRMVNCFEQTRIAGFAFHLGVVLPLSFFYLRLFLLRRTTCNSGYNHFVLLFI
jgi:hypothetical protein